MNYSYSCRSIFWSAHFPRSLRCSPKVGENKIENKISCAVKLLPVLSFGLLWNYHIDMQWRFQWTLRWNSQFKAFCETMPEFELWLDSPTSLRLLKPSSMSEARDAKVGVKVTDHKSKGILATNCLLTVSIVANLLPLLRLRGNAFSLKFVRVLELYGEFSGPTTKNRLTGMQNKPILGWN